jgi:hypothetical protein
MVDRSFGIGVRRHPEDNLLLVMLFRFACFPTSLNRLRPMIARSAAIAFDLFRARIGNVCIWHNRDFLHSSHEVRFRAMAKPASMTDMGAKQNGRSWPKAARPLSG